MKNIILIIALLLCLALSASAEWLKGDFTFQAGWVPNGAINCCDPGIAYSVYNNFDISFEICTVLFDYIKIDGYMVNYFSYDSSFSFDPTGMTFGFKAGFVFNFIFFMYEHACTHPVLTRFDDKIHLNSSYDRFYVELKYSF